MAIIDSCQYRDAKPWPSSVRWWSGVNKNEVVGPTRLARIRLEKSELAYLKLGKSCCDVTALCPHHLTRSTDSYSESHNYRIFLLHHHQQSIQVSIINRPQQVLDQSSSILRRPLFTNYHHVVPRPHPAPDRSDR